MSESDVPASASDASPAASVPTEPLRTAAAFAGEALMPGGSNLIKGDIRQTVIHVAGSMVARSVFGLPGAILVGSNSFVKATTGRHLHEHLGITRWPPAR